MLTVSIVTHKTPYPQLEKAVDCLLHEVKESGSEEYGISQSFIVDKIYIIDNSPDDSLKKIEEKDKRIDYRHVANEGFGAGHNVALREILSRKQTSDDYHLVMNADVCWEGNDILSKLTGYLEKNPDVGMAMPKVFYPDGDLQFTCRMLPTPFDLFAKRFLPAALTRKRMEKYLLQTHDHDKEINCPYLLGSFLLFRTRALEKSGIFDTKFFMYPEDIDITRRVHRDFRTMYWPGVSVIHEHAAASKKNGKMLRIHFVNMVRYFNKWGWIFDKERREFNRKLSDSVAFIPKPLRPRGRG